MPNCFWPAYTFALCTHWHKHRHIKKHWHTHTHRRIHVRIQYTQSNAPFRTSSYCFLCATHENQTTNTETVLNGFGRALDSSTPIKIEIHSWAHSESIWIFYLMPFAVLCNTLHFLNAIFGGKCTVTITFTVNKNEYRFISCDR